MAELTAASAPRELLLRGRAEELLGAEVRVGGLEAGEVARSHSPPPAAQRRWKSPASDICCSDLLLGAEHVAETDDDGLHGRAVLATFSGISVKSLQSSTG